MQVDSWPLDSSNFFLMSDCRILSLVSFLMLLVGGLIEDSITIRSDFGLHDPCSCIYFPKCMCVLLVCGLPPI